MKKPKNSKKQVRFHDGALWLRLSQIIKVEEFDGPVEWGRIRQFCSDVPVSELNRMLAEMARAGALSVAREWPERAGERMIETYILGRANR